MLDIARVTNVHFGNVYSRLRAASECLEGGRPPPQFTAAAVTLFLVGQWAQDELQSVEPTGPVPAVTWLFFFRTLFKLSL